MFQPPDFIPEPSLEHYTRGRRLGKGGQGSVHEYRNGDMGKIYAVKVMEYDFDDLENGEPTNKVKIRREIHVSVSPRLAHAHLLRAYAVFGYEEGYAIIMPYFRRGSLRHKVLSTAELKDATRQILEALRHLHENGQIHRDIKADNILVRNGENEPLDLVVTDYGLISLENPVSFCGTKGYAAPEVVRNMFVEKTKRPRYSSSVDIYALGMLILNALGVELPTMWIRTRAQHNNSISAPIAVAIDECNSDDMERRDALSAIDSMLRFNATDRPSVDECLRLPWLTSPIDSPQAAQMARTQSNFSMVVPLWNLSVADPVETWWHSTPRAVAPAQQAQQDGLDSGRYDFREETRKRKQRMRPNPVITPKKFKVQKRPYNSLPTPKKYKVPKRPYCSLATPELTPDKNEIAQQPSSSHPLKCPKFGVLESIAVNKEATRETNDLMSWDKIKLSE